MDFLVLMLVIMADGKGGFVGLPFFFWAKASLVKA
jgi:hypothetical protein